MRNKPKLHIVILAAGAGTRMRSALPKVLHPIMGKPILRHVLDTAKKLQPNKIWLIYGHQGEKLQSVLQDTDIHWVKQAPRLGTGHALMQLYPQLVQQAQPDDAVLIISADSPKISETCLLKMVQQQSENDLVLLTLLLQDPTGFGRVIRDAQQHISGIVEEKDTNSQQAQIKEIYSGIMLIKFSALTACLGELTNQNAQQEYYLTQLIELCYQKKIPIGSNLSLDSFEARGINDRVQLSELERHMQIEKAKELMLQGVTIVDPLRFDLRGTLQAATDVFIDINCIIEGNVSIGTQTKIGAHCILKDCILGEGVEIKPYTMIDGATIANDVHIGPFARIRPGSILEEAAHIGNFVEVKKSIIGKNSKASHLSYLGDATIGASVNIGAGTITCNYDGVNKHQTYIGDGAFIGSNSALVAPITVGANATIGAGSTVTREVPADHLTVARSKAVTLPGWHRPSKTKTDSD